MGYDFYYKFITKEEKEAFEKCDSEQDWDYDTYDTAEKYHISRHNYKLYGGVYDKQQLIDRMNEVFEEIKKKTMAFCDDDDEREAFFVYSFLLREFSNDKDLDMWLHIYYGD